MHRFYSLFFPGFINSAETVPGRKFPTRKLRFYCIEAAGYDKIKWIFYKHCTDSECDENTELRLLKYFNKEAYIMKTIRLVSLAAFDYLHGKYGNAGGFMIIRKNF